MNFDLPNITLGLLFLLLCCLCLWYYFCVMLPFSKIPSSRAELFLIRSFLSSDKIAASVFELMNNLVKQYFSEGLLVIWIIKPIVFLFKDEYIKDVWNNNLNKAAEYRYFHEYFGVGLFTGDKLLWKKRRKMFNPLFRTGILNGKLNIFNKYSRKLVDDFSKMDLTSLIEIEKPLKRFSFNVMSEAILGLDKEESLYGSEMEMFFEIVDTAGEFFTHRIFKPWLYFMELFPEGRAYLMKMKAANEFAKKQLMKLKETVLSRMASETTNESDSEYKMSNKSFAEILLENHVKDPAFTMEDMLSEIKTFMAGGYDTVSGQLIWILYLLGQHLDVQDHVYEEVKSLNENLNSEDLQHMTYMENVIKENFRLYPAIPIFGRSLEHDMHLGKYKIPKGTSVIVNAYPYHRDPKVFQNPDEFDPNRFLNGNLENNQWNLIPFSAGIRNCIGNKFAMLEMKVVLAHILRKFKIISSDDYRSTKVSWEVLLKPDKTIRVKLVPRQ